MIDFCKANEIRRREKVTLSPLPQPHLEYETTSFLPELLYPLLADLHFAEVPFIRVFAPVLLRSLCTAQGGHLSL